MLNMTARSYVIWSMVCVVVLLCFAYGCDRKREDAGSESAEIDMWRSKYETLVQQNEGIYKELDDLRSQNEALGGEVEALKGKMKEKDKAKEAANRESKELSELEERIAQRDETIEKLLEQVKRLKDDLATASGKGLGEASLSKRVKVRSELEELGKLMLDEGRIDVARLMLTNAVELGSDEPGILFLVAYCFGERGDDNAAAEWYARVVAAVEKQPEEQAALLPKLYNNYGATLVRLGEVDEALKWYQKSIQADEKYPAVHFNLGRLYAEHRHAPGEAIEAYRRHVALGGSRSVAARNAILKLQQKQTEEKGEEKVPPAAPEQ